MPFMKILFCKKNIKNMKSIKIKWKLFNQINFKLKWANRPKGNH